MKILDKRIIKAIPVEGGSVSKTERVQTESGQWFFVKSSPKNTPLFLEEARGLTEIAALRVIECPDVIEVDERKLVLRWIETATPKHEFWVSLGHKLARMHVQLQESFGFPINNHIGPTPQANPMFSPDDMPWADYFFEYRLEPLISHPKLKGDQELQARFRQTEAVMKRHLADVNEPPSLLHGDLWSGNVLCNKDLQPVLLDPAPYYGHREADVAMTELFGGFAPEFYVAYRKEFPLQPAYEQRKLIYNLYHRLNHWIIFGDSYRAGALATLKNFAN